MPAVVARMRRRKFLQAIHQLVVVPVALVCKMSPAPLHQAAGAGGRHLARHGKPHERATARHVGYFFSRNSFITSIASNRFSRAFCFSNSRSRFTSGSLIDPYLRLQA